MKISKNIYLAAMAAAVAGAAGLSSCSDTLEIQPLEYKEDPNFAPPHIQAAWNLEEIPSDMVGDGAYAYKDKLYNGLFTRTLGWNGGDGVETTLLPDGNLWWTFNDSFYGVVNGEDRSRKSCSFPRNTVMVQTTDETGRLGETDEHLRWLASFVQTTDPNKDRYYQARTHLRHPKGELSEADIQRGDIDQKWLYWAGDGTIVDGKLQQLWNGVNTPGNGDMIQHNTALAIYSLDGKYGDESYLQLEAVDHDFIPENTYGYGSTLWEDEDGHTYLYSSTGNGQFLGNVPIVARSTTHDLRSTWEYYVPNDEGEMVWQTEYPIDVQAKSSGIAPDQGSLTLPWVFKKGDWYYMTAQTFPFGHELVIMRAEHPWGPFKDKKTLLKFPNPLDELQLGEYQNLYMLHLHQGLAREDELVISTNTDAKDFWDNFNAPGSADWYRPFFYRIFKWERVFDH